MAKDLCLFGGTFDPVHYGHLIIARAVAEAKGFSRVTLVPANNPPHKPPTRAPAADRLEMLKLAVEGDGLFEVCDLELHRQGPSYTLNTLQALRDKPAGARMHWLIGADSLAELPHWHRVEEVLDLARLLIAARPMEGRSAEDALASLAGKLPERHLRALRDAIVPTPLIDISSSDIRRRVHQGRSIRYLVPEPVARYIAERGLYRDADPPPENPGERPCPR
ncbi:MAG: nicotinate-nucleotide adenylyltransferase [Phycisphaerae bacterium]|nr:nicotinate-nucleotide adenylyltransferase [Phycisphaerae bacterium]